MRRSIDVIATAQDAMSRNLEGHLAVVIDVLRATSVMSVAIRNGAKQIVAVSSVEEAFSLRDSGRFGDVLLGGERNAMKIEGFDLDNSPYNYVNECVDGKTIVMTTTNGTQALCATSKAAKTLVCSFLNVDAVATEIAESDMPVSIICAGTEGRFTLEDGLCAGSLVSRVLSLGDNLILSDFAVAMKNLVDNSSKNLYEMASEGEHFVRLQKKGFGRDAEICLNSTMTLPTLKVKEHFDGKVYVVGE